MNSEQYDRIKTGRGFFAALDESGGSTPRTLARYGIPESAYSNDSEMFDLVHAMRTRVMRSPGFNGDRILGTILFENTMDRQIEGKGSADYLWDVKHVVPFLKVDKGLEPEVNGAQIMKPIPGLGSLLERARGLNVFGTKMRSFIKLPDESGVKAVVTQQFEIASEILSAGLVPIIEPEVDIASPGKAEAEAMLHTAIGEGLAGVPEGQSVMLKLSLPERDDLYADFVAHPKVARVLALSGGYSRDEAVARLVRNRGVIASFARALMEGLSVDQSDQDFDATLDASIAAIYQASLT
ncbi:MAG: fructose bisphosphate aldolase [Acidimicrobiales bacterium]|nr:fructose bisphosphate aldolase [Acidimicrobiales bacterium]